MNDPLDSKLSAHFKASTTGRLPAQNFSLRVLAALPPVSPPSTLARVWAYVLAWDTPLLVVAASLAIVFWLPVGQKSTGLDFFDRMVGLFTTWPALVSLGAAFAASFLLNDDEEEELPRQGPAWF